MKVVTSLQGRLEVASYKATSLSCSLEIGPKLLLLSAPSVNDTTLLPGFLDTTETNGFCNWGCTGMLLRRLAVDRKCNAA
ncbi:hypothetical protein TGPRC2_210783 [Toxoplasma gondii TgCatPRC2]|uniref:Uncharacterized protein n=14 Tax=Toxoplasma gondii TaxID=5811 RepID=A0A125YNR5_TOXGV|nr:hypothetical protein TGME49_210783 [Toxoplasma gondii ME49]EPR58302.1 hypothetical protein TGGT1_210783 [Toxoplasma gondii GT1]ESS29675.1 hypothetical protein TGVEG_210783 [Toxoplasma gondii VEG]KAF4645095.1 hypothetical protein TGRH88_009110 [Toxoplasma gondii]KFG30724.1 hypothetical protein TGDOM2_210783 [Toxoplasma gondii GAB2-2007-GAL-DOM2]KFG38726.1 hypothetical protein TGFOU_210783 [Toxoplasma gondii FOU]KFG43129.1 hypothetical protein TGP89_210783 [Toxoplasma gondii p89]KFG57902.1 |eukprot:XP_018637960.1 hypothetical protein TGME49_210783 [Toxoplasma gondii ME49]